MVGTVEVGSMMMNCFSPVVREFLQLDENQDEPGAPVGGASASVDDDDVSIG